MGRRERAHDDRERGERASSRPGWGPRRARPRRPGDDGWRLFVAAYPPVAVADALRDHLARVDDDPEDGPLPAHRSTPVDQVHLTLLFIGDTDRRDVDAVTTSVERAAAGIEPFTLHLDRLVTLPERGPRRLVAATAPPVGPLEFLQERLAARLAKREGKKRRPFLPHLTLARFRAPTPKYRLDRPLPALAFPVESVALVRSYLKPGGAVHREVEAFPLSGTRER